MRRDYHKECWEASVLSYGKCGEDFIVSNNLCAKTCGRCSAAGPAPSQPAAPPPSPPPPRPSPSPPPPPPPTPAPSPPPSPSPPPPNPSPPAPSPGPPSGQCVDKSVPYISCKQLSDIGNCYLQEVVDNDLCAATCKRWHTSEAPLSTFRAAQTPTTQQQPPAASQPPICALQRPFTVISTFTVPSTQQRLPTAPFRLT
ncbi:hypothetical protein N2152v2_010569 [Parachlorella kessleri]